MRFCALWAASNAHISNAHISNAHAQRPSPNRVLKHITSFRIGSYAAHVSSGAAPAPCERWDAACMSPPVIRRLPVKQSGVLTCANACMLCEYQ